MGDSLLAWNELSGESVSHSVERSLNEPVIDRTVRGAKIMYPLPISGALGMSIEKQYTDGDWDWIILNGGGNDLWLGCGCIRCDGTINSMISEDGRSGKIPAMVSKLRNTNAKVIFVGYLRSPGVGSPIEHCKDEGDILESRVARLAEQDDGFYYLSLRDMVPHGSTQYHAIDMIHPSIRASQEIGKRVAELVTAAEGNTTQN
ncbi:MAG: SGNH/GDSL hydrolase family protein [Pseudoruegeria sp.]